MENWLASTLFTLTNTQKKKSNVSTRLRYFKNNRLQITDNKRIVVMIKINKIFN